MKNLKQIFFVKTLILVSTYNLQAQPCKQVELATDLSRKRVLQQFIEECRQGRYFVEDKGIISLTTYQNAKGQQVWSVSAMIDDRYKENPPTAYCRFGEDIILVYQADSIGRINQASAQDITSVNSFLGEIIENRVYQQPKIKVRMVEIPQPNGKTKKIPAHFIIGGNYWNSKTIIFHKDNTYKILTGV